MGSVQVQFAIDDRTRGDAIVTDLLERRLVACAQTIGPVSSRYWWDGSIQQSDEWLFLAKTTTERLDTVIERIRGSHPYAVPEIIASELFAGLGAYLDWIAAETQESRTQGPPPAARS